MSQVRIERLQLVRAKHLLNTQYSASELGREIGVDPDVLRRSWVTAGCPCEQDEDGHRWYNGVKVREWLRAQVDIQKRKTKMSEGFAYCVSCRKPVPLTVEGVPRPVSQVLALARGTCPECGHQVNRACVRKDAENAR